MRTSVYFGSTLISDKVLEIRPVQHTFEVRNHLLDGSFHIQVIGEPAQSWELGFVVHATEREVINSYAARKDRLILHRHGKQHTGIIDGNPEWEQIVGSDDPARAVYLCRIVLLEVAE